MGFGQIRSFSILLVERAVGNDGAGRDFAVFWIQPGIRRALGEAHPSYV